MPPDGAEKQRSQRGQATPLIIGFAAVVLLLVVTVVDASTAYLGHQRLDALADGASLRGADAAAQGRSAYAHGLGHAPLDLTASRARAAVRQYLREVGALRDHPGLHASVRVVNDRVVVELRAPVALPLHLPGVPLRPGVRSVGSAEVRPDERG